MLYIAEKPNVAQALTKAIGTSFSSKDGYFTDGQNIVTWCFGHMLQLQNPEDYDPKYQHWKLEDIPFFFLPYKRKNNPATSKQLKVIKDLIKQAKTIVNVGDPDDEGQLLVDEILREVGNTKPVKRVLINDNNTKVVQKALANMEDNSKYEYMGYRAEARAVADQLFGFNLTRSYSIHHAAKTKKRALISVGRVQSAILGLVVRRDREHASHQKAFYYNIFGDFIVGNTEFTAKFVPSEHQKTDDKNRLTNPAEAENIANFCKDKPSKITLAETVDKSTPPPLPYNLIKLQQDCSKKFGMNPSKTLEITQSLREKHQLITYNRSDCQYLSEEQHLDAPNVLNCISQNLSDLSDSVRSSDASRKGRVFDTSKVSAHHAIIPTESVVDFAKLSNDEAKVYRLIAVSYLAQFYPDYEYIQTKIEIDVGGYQFAVTANIPTVQGWKVLFSNEPETDESEQDQESQLDLRQIKQDDLGICSNTKVKQEATKPLPLYTMASLLADLTRVAKYIKDPSLAKILKERDKDKEGENGGIGTPATRDSIINTLFTRGFLLDGKNIVSTPTGQELYDQLSDRIRFPDLTAIWTEKFEAVKTQQDVVNFVHYLMAEHINPEVAQIKQLCGEIQPSPAAATTATATQPCPQCTRPMILRDGKFGKYWGCTGFFDKEKQCKHIMNDKDGTPIEKAPKADPVQSDSVDSTTKVFLTVAYADKDKVKALGAKWDKDNKSWFIPAGVDQTKFSKWL